MFNKRRDVDIIESNPAVQRMEKPMNNPKVPQPDSIQELARFWDTHDLTWFTSEMSKYEFRPTKVSNKGGHCYGSHGITHTATRVKPFG